MKHHVLAAAAAALLLAVTMTGCEKMEHYTITCKNLTGVEISEISAAPETNKSEYINLIDENFADGAEIILDFGKYTQEDTAQGFAVNVENAADGSVGEFSMLMLSPGDTISFYIDDWGLAVGVNMTDAEIEEQKAADHEDYLEMVAEEKAAAASEEAAADESEEE